MGKLLISKSGFELQEIDLEHGTVCIGRAKDNDIQLNDATVSSHHAKIVTVMSTSYIQDLGSTNGIFVNGDPVVVQALHADDVIAIGNHEIVFQQKNASQSSRQDEDVYDTQLVNSIAGSGSSHSHQKSVSSEKVFTDFRDTIGYSDLGQANPGLRVVVDNTTGPAEQHALDIDINIDRFLGDKPKLDKAPNIIKENKRSESERPYTQTYPYVEVPDMAESKFGEPEIKKIEEDLLAAETSSGQQPIQQESRTSTSEIEKYDEHPAKKSEATKSLHSKQPFMSSEEVVEQLIEMSRSKSKRSKKSSGLSSVLGIFTFLLIAVAIYYQLQ